MATLTIRDLDEGVRARLRVRAAEHGRSMEAEVRHILTEAVPPAVPLRGLGSRIRARVLDGPQTEDLEVVRDRGTGRPVDLQL